MIFQSDKLNTNGRSTQLVASIKQAIRTKIETSLMWNFTGVSIPATAVVQIDPSGNRRVSLTTAGVATEQFGVVEELAIANSARGIIRRRGIARVRLDATTGAPACGSVVLISATNDGYGHIGGFGPRVGTVTDASGYSPATPYVLVLIRRCTCVAQ